ncbi:hypothetical protein MSAN_01808400 [Mycena sanguinolenta]|uniref:Uncharacterized protein n=1 Tax=Mycena sanguinolenta TaxID=230812 RepID=A0A8H7CQR6_9AGAR|nr:hypothetical protein MSAN_01808400 [Mycena sanguinolenta]
MSLPLPALDNLTGCILIATWASSLLYMLEIIQGLYYFRHFQHDDWKSKTLVTVALVVDSLSFIGDYICVYEYTITHAGDLGYLATIHWPLPLYGFTTGVLGALVQTFLVSRYWRFTHKTVIATFLALAIITSCGSVFACSVMLILYPSFETRGKFKIPMACVSHHLQKFMHSRTLRVLCNFNLLRLWLVTEVVVDSGITSVLLWEFRKAEGILTETRGCVMWQFVYLLGSGTSSALDRLKGGNNSERGDGRDARCWGSDGSPSCPYTPSDASTSSLWFASPCAQIGLLFTISQLSNLNVRKSEKSFSTTGTSSGPETSSSEREPPTLTTWATDDPYGNHVHNTFRSTVQAGSAQS